MKDGVPAKYIRRTKIIIMKKIICIAFVLILIFPSCKKQVSNSNPVSNNDHGYVIYAGISYPFTDYIVSNVSTPPSHFYLTLGGGYTNGYRHTIGMRLSDRPGGNGVINLENNSGSNFVDLVIHDTNVLNSDPGNFHYYCKSGETISYSTANGKLRITGNNLTETDEYGNVIPNGHSMTFVSQE